MDRQRLIDLAMQEVRDEIKRQEEQWGGIEHDATHTARDWICIVTKHLGKAFDEDDARHKYAYERGVDRRFIKIAAIAVSAALGLRESFR